MKQSSFAIAIVACFVLTASAHAQVVFNNITQPIASSDLVATVGPISMSFSSGPGGSLTDVQLFLFDPVADDTGTTTIDLFSDNSGEPGSVIAGLDAVANSALPTTDASPFDIPLSGISLNPGTEYWIYVAGNANSQLGWTDSTSGVGLSGQFFQNHNGTFSDTLDEGEPYNMAVALNGADIPSAATPEPGSLALLATAGVSALGLLR